MLQHRGQDSAGMVSTDWDHFVEHKGNGLVRDVFKEEKVMNSLKGMLSILQQCSKPFLQSSIHRLGYPAAPLR